MKFFLTKDEKELVKNYKNYHRRLTKDEIKKIEYIEWFIEIRRPFIISLIALLISVLNLILKMIL